MSIQQDLRSIGTKDRAISSARFFKTSPGQYGEGDIFLGVTVPNTRKIVNKYVTNLSLENVQQLLASKYHEERLAGVLCLVYFAQNNRYPIQELAKFYLSHADQINNWDLVDCSSEYIVGPYLETLDHKTRKKLIDDCIQSNSLWLNRIIVLASFDQIKKGNEKLTFYIASKFLDHKHDLIHKAVGWMLREVGKRIDERLLTSFLDEYANKMPRTMLRYAIERLSLKQKEYYLYGKSD